MGEGNSTRVRTNRLPWDSEFLGLEVYRVAASAPDAAAVKTALSSVAAAGGRLAYVTCAEAFEGPLDGPSGPVVLVDEKRTYARPLPAEAIALAPLPDVPWVELAAPSAVSAADAVRLEELAVAAGVHSRFRVDPSFPTERFEEMYRIWMRRSLAGELADAVLMIGATGAIDAMVTVQCQGDDAVIGLLAVDAAQRGRGLGSALVQAVLRWGCVRALHRARVVTQGANREACKLYEGSGYLCVDRLFYYHAWL
ncbi:MAG: GNAT family N-acetyltransferase [Polyangiales bacterium]